jgi:hypothetical protein
MSARLLMIALDGADGRFLERCSDDASFPNLAGLRGRGRTKRLSARPGLTDDAVWACFQYAADLGEHGRYHYWQRLADGRFGSPQANEDDREAFWDRLSDRGQRVAVFDIPKAREPRPLNGLHLADWLVHGRSFPEPHSYPAELAGEVVARFGAARPSRCAAEFPRMSDEEVAENVDNLRQSIAMKRAAGMDCLRREAWDLFAIAFKELHCCSHAFWDFTDSDHPAHDAERLERLGDPAAILLGDIDCAVGDLVSAAGPAADVLIFTPSDIAPNGSLEHLMPSLMVRLNQALSGGAGVGWRCRMLPYTENVGALRIEYDKRLAEGAPAEPGRFEAAREAVVVLLGELTDADTGEKVVAMVSRPSTDCDGARRRQLPDLLVHCRSGIFPRAVVSDRLGTIAATSPRMRVGNHVSGGFLIAAGSAADAAADRVETLADFGPLAEQILRPRPAKAVEHSARRLP